MLIQYTFYKGTPDFENNKEHLIESHGNYYYKDEINGWASYEELQKERNMMNVKFSILLRPKPVSIFQKLT